MAVRAKNETPLFQIYQTVNMGEEVGPGGDQARTPLNESQGSQKDANQEHLERMTDYKSYAKVLNSYLTSLANYVVSAM